MMQPSDHAGLTPELTRRQFLKLGAAAATVWTATQPGALGAQTPRRLRAGFLGGSHAHARDKWRLVRASDQFELVGMAENSGPVRAAYGPLGAKFMSPEELVARSEVVIVESDVADHGRHALLALRAGKHVHVEKPPADNLADVEQMVKLAREHNLVLQVGYMWRHHPGFAAIFEAMRRGWLGDVYLVRGIINNQLAADRRAEWGQFRGGGLFELGAHLVDALVRLLGEPRQVQSTLRTHGQPDDDLHDNNVAVFEFSRALGIITNTTLQPNAGSHRLFEVLGTNGTAVLKPIEPPTLELDLAKAAGPYQPGRQTVPMPGYERYVGDLVELAAAVRGERNLAVTLEEELRVQRWLLRASEMSQPTPAENRE